ncbi:MAG: beta-galactosidase [Clostridia bacterium]|nr:beta-galactosidase [Clostridia bacterium]
MTFETSWLSDPEIFSVNRLPAVSDHQIYRTAPEADADMSSLVRSLDGIWKAHFAACPVEAPDALLTCGDGDAALAEITVPGEFQLQNPDWDCPQYANVQYPWDGKDALVPPQVSDIHNPTVTAIRTFDLSAADLDCGRVVLTFNGVEAALALYVNGQFVGYSEDSFTPHHFDVTPFVQQGANRLAARIFKRCSGSWLEDQDFWRYSGIHRSVTLTFEPKVHLADIFVRTPLTDNYTRAHLEADLTIHRPQGNVTAVLQSVSGEVLMVETQPAAEQLHFCREVPGVKLWSAEEPNLYALTITITDDNDDVVEVSRLQVGFRQFEMINKVMCLNGKRIVFRGVNRHEFDCDTGRVMSTDLMLKDIRNCKAMNINAIRTSHYPNTSEFYRLCDRYGLYIIDETNMETHGTWAYHQKYVLPCDVPEWQSAVLDRGRSMLERDKNHACILLWSCGNESWGGKNIYELSQFFRQRDNTRLVHYEGVTWDGRYAATTDVHSQMYCKAVDIEKYLNNNPDKPFINCEYIHAMGNSLGGMKLYTDLEDKYPMYQGGFIWDYVDQFLRTTAPNGHTRMTIGGDWGDRPTDWEFIGNGIVMADRSLSPKAQDVRYLYQDVRLTPDATGVTVESRRLFAPLTGLTLKWSIACDGKLVRAGGLLVPNVAPGESIHLDLPYGEVPETGLLVATCQLLHKGHAILPDGEIMAVGQALLREAAPAEAPACAPAPVIGDVNVGMHTPELSVLFQKGKAGIISIKDKLGRESLLRAPQLSLFRAPTDNDRGNGDAIRQGIWNAVSRYAFINNDEPVYENGVFSITYHYAAPVLPGTDITVTYTIRTPDAIEVTLRWPGVENQPDLPALGLSFQLDPRLNKVCYYGYGPEENYADRKEGALLGTYTYAVEDGWTRYGNPQESGNRMGVRRMAITDETGHGVEVSGNGLEVSVQPYLPEEVMAAAHPEELQGSCRTVLDVALFRKGVGGDDSWGAPVLEQFTYPSSKPYTLTFTMKAL